MKQRIMAIFLSLCMMIGLLPATALAAGIELDISEGSIIITDNGYSQGTLVYDENSGYLVQNEQGDPVQEMTWSGSHELTITGTYESGSSGSVDNTIIIMGGDPTITLDGITVKQNVQDTPGLVLMDGSATLVLEGENTLQGASNGPGVQINKDAVLTIKGDGTLNATSNGFASGIGASRVNTFAVNPDTRSKDNSMCSGGELIITGGTVTAKRGGSGDYVYGIGGYQNNLLKNVTITGGDVTAEGWSGIIKVSDKIEISGGKVQLATGRGGGGTGLTASTIEVSGGTLARAKTNIVAFSTTPTITGGNIGDCYTGEIEGRTLIQLCFFSDNGDPLGDTEVTVTEGDHEWSAFTDKDGVITAYLADSTESIQVQIGGENEEAVFITGSKVPVGASCICEDRSGFLTMSTKSQSLTTVNGTATLDLNSQYQKGDCVLPEGFHGDYENISYEITKVMKNGQYMSTDKYAGIKDNTLMVYGDANEDPYTVYVRAKCGTSGYEVYSDEIAIAVNTYVSEAQTGELDISNGAIIITETGYSQGTLVYTNKNGEGYSVQDEKGQTVTETSWENEEQKLTITGTYESSGNGGLDQPIIIMGGAPEITLKNVTVKQSVQSTPGLVLMGGSAALVLEGENTLQGGNYGPGVQINKDAVLTIDGEGTLNAQNSNNAAGIGAPRNNTYAVNLTTGLRDNNMRSGGQLVIAGGTINATGNGSVDAGIGKGQNYNLEKITIQGGNVTASGHEVAMTASDSVDISGRKVHLITRSTGTGTGINSTSVNISGGTLTEALSKGSVFPSVAPNITGGNITGCFDGEISGRQLTKLYFVEDNGTPKANTEVTVTEGEAPDANTWTAYTDENGIITTYLADATTEISATIDMQTYNNISVSNHQALIGGDCSCSSFTGITWETGLPGSITLHNLQDGENPVSMNYDVPAAQLVTDQPCNMPIHPSLPEIEYELSVTKNEASVAEGNLAEYASFINNHLTLLPENAPYTVTLTAKAGDGEAKKTASHSIIVYKGETSGGETGTISTINLALGDAVINYTEDEGYTYTQGDMSGALSSGTILITGFAADGSVTVNGGSPTLIINQNHPQDVWTIYSGENAGNITLQPRTFPFTFNDKLRFGAEGSSLPELSYVSATGKLKLNPDQGNIIFKADDSVTQGKFIITQLSGNIEEYVVMGGDTEEARTVTNNSSALITLEINGESVELAANDGSHGIPKAEDSRIGATTKTYLFSNGDGTYTLIAAGEGNADASNYGDTQSKITAAIFDRDFTGRLRADNILYDVNLSELHAEQFSDISVKGSMLGHVYIGPNMTNISWGNYCMTTGFTVDPNNPAYTTDDKGALYSKDYSTLVVIPSQWTGSYTTHENCTTIGKYATMRLRLDSLTIGKNVQTIEGGSYLFFSNLLSAIYVEAGNQYFASKDGILYDKEMTAILACPGKLALKELTVPETVTNVGAYIFQNIGIEKLIIPEGAEISGDRAGFTRMYNLKELEMLGSYSGYIDGAAALEKLTVYDGFNFAQNLDGDGNTPDSSMSWIKTAGITVTGGENAAYDGQSQKVEVTTTAPNLTVEYSTDGNEWSANAPAAVSAPSTYTVYWRITKPADETYDFDRVLYSSRTFTIGGLEASEDWFTLSEPVTVNEAGTTTPVTLHKPAGAPSLEGGYTVKYNGITDVPTTAGSYLVTVEITAEGYVQETLTLGNYVILSEADREKYVISFVTNGGEPIKPIIEASNDDITEKVNAINPTRAGYTFAGWYSDSALRDKVESLPTTMPGEHTTYYAKWTRDAYTITYHLDDGTVSGNPEGYTAETPTFTLKNPTKAGYEFTGWTGTELSEKTKEVTIEKGSSGNRVYTANWEEIEYTITYPKDYDKVSGNKETYTINDTLNSAISLTNPSREGYSFKGWTMVVDGSTSYILPAENAEIPVGTLGNLTLSGIWLADNQTLTFHANGGKFANGTETYVISGAYDSPLSLDVTNPTRSGYRFRGWFTDEECTQLFEASNIETMPLSMNIYAGWKKKSSSSSESTEGSGTSSVSDHVVITTNSGKLTDSQIEEAVKKAEKDSVITIQAVKSDEVVLRAGAMETLVENENDLLIQLRDGEVTLPVKAMKGLIEGAKSSYEIGVSLEEQTSSDDATVSELLEKGAVIFDVVITVNGKEIHSFDKGLTLAFKVPGLKDMEEPVVLHLLQDGEQESYKPDEISGDTLTIKGIKNLSVFAVLSGNEEKAETENPFADVFENDYYFNSVLWAVTNGVTAGTSDITFSPDVTVSRAQMVTFLWRAAGSPAAEGSNPFTDVSVSDYYYNAVLWAVANGVTAGTSDTTFSPDAPVSRAQAVTFQWRAAGGPAVSGESFTDIPEGAYYAPAVTWAVANGITSGTGDHQFSPDAPVSRAQAVTFLYRQYK
ncbi:hypothetical protein B5G26_14975 [Anaerotignum lactatifermentans]|uniref:SLH domain-containing protein n=1 Tax=Anaerotignum lactatifermentans TaxID=160404 RepID=A0A1Y3TT73_9FIRM|nr:InlB B-repeat-containing protein [Anaerotignum lactatifermentans]OUN39756.1 hypothetical protein B5G26_14975 [Anaerotignum lactatifermentans]